MEYKLIRFMQKRIFKASNSFQPQSEPGSQNVDGIYTFHNDISYTSQYPNSFLDIYVKRNAAQNRYPTLIFVHGGGFVWGDKSDYAPDPKKPGSDWYFRSFLEAGYNIVCINYAFAPEYHYPVPVRQLDDAVRFLLQYGNKWGLDMSRLIFAGNSAGANIAGQYVNVQTNCIYAEEMHMKRTVCAGEIKAVLFNSGLLDNERFGETGDKQTDGLFTKCGNTYFDCMQLEGNPDACQSNVIQHAAAGFPPAFISDGNKGTFTTQAKEMAEKLKELGIVHTLNLYDRSEKKLGHDFERRNDQYGQDNMQKMLAFLEGEVKRTFVGSVRLD